MKSTTLFNAIGGAKDQYLAKTEKRRKPFSQYSGWIACAACFSIAVICLALFRPQQPAQIIDPTPTVSEILLKIDAADLYSADAMGYEAYHAYDISQIKNGNPWNEDETPDILPVYRNNSYNPYTSSYGLTEPEMLSILYDALDFFDIKIYDKSFTGIKKHLFSDSNRDPRGFLIPDDTVTRIELTVEFGQIEVTANGTVTVRFDKPPVIPDGYDISVNPEETLLHCAEMFAGLLRFDKPTVAVQESYFSLGEINNTYKVYDADGDITEQILEYTYEYAEFLFDSEGYMSMIRIYNYRSVTEELGKYPTISREKAQELLVGGTYYSSYIETDFPGEEYLEGVEIVYRNNHLEKAWIPYYRFYVELTEREAEDGLKTYVTYYVPAIDPEYIASYPPSNVEFGEIQ